MVGLGKMWVLVMVGRHNPSNRLLLWPLGGGHESAESEPTRLARNLVVAVPAALQKEHPLSAGRIPTDVVAGRGAIVARHVSVVEELSGQSVLLLVSS